jgi:hypothetical protein
MHQKEIQEENKTSIIMDIYKLDVLMHEYLLHLEERPREQWKIQNNTLSLLLNGISSKNPKDESVLKTLRNNQAHITEQFSRIISLHEDPDSKKDVDFFRKINKHLQSRIELGSQNMIRHSVQLYQRSQKDLINIHKRMGWLLIRSFRMQRKLSAPEILIFRSLQREMMNWASSAKHLTKWSHA